jgi:hypothetical protein
MKTVPAGTDRARAVAALERTKSACLVSASISTPIRPVAHVQAAEPSRCRRRADGAIHRKRM